VEGGRAFLGPLEVEFSGNLHPTGQPARGLVRPYDLDIERRSNGRSGFRARVEHINAAGPHVKIDLLAESGETVHVELTQQRFRKLGLVSGETVFVRPREINVFVDDRKDEEALRENHEDPPDG
jgi:sulfate transport system ATP-binding protein